MMYLPSVSTFAESGSKQADAAKQRQQSEQQQSAPRLPPSFSSSSNAESKNAGNKVVQDSLPDVPSHFCFRRAVLVDEDFSVDSFILQHQAGVPLDQLKEQLGSYLRSLRLALLDLLNADYADFIDLSSNLVGLNRRIDLLIEPLRGLRDQLAKLRSHLQQTHEDIQDKRAQLHWVRDMQGQLQLLIQVRQLTDSIQEALGTVADSSDNNINSEPKSDSLNDDTNTSQQVQICKLSNAMLEKFSFQIFEAELRLTALEQDLLQELTNDHHQQTPSSQQQQIKLADQLPLVRKLADRISQMLQQQFLAAIRNGRIDTLRFILDVYATNQRLPELEQLFIANCVRPLLQDLFNEEHLSTHGAQDTFSSVLRLIQPHFSVLLQLQSDLPYLDQFLINTLWTEIVDRLIRDCDSLFQVGNANAFHANYIAFEQFVNQYQQIILMRRQLLTHPQYIRLQSMFKVKMYFHIRASEQLRLLDTVLRQNSPDASDSTIQTRGSNVADALLSSLRILWSSQVFLAPLFVDFWRLSLQILCRYTLFLKAFATSSTSDAVSLSPTTSQSQIDAIIQLNDDSVQMCNQVKQFCVECILPKRPAGCSKIKLINCLNDSLKLIQQDGLPQLQSDIKSLVIEQSLAQLTQIKDIPRLFRKTNRDVPSRPSNYVETCIHLLEKFKQAKSLPSSALIDVVDLTLQSFNSFVTDVLTSVQKMEESLKRLKKVQANSANVGGSGQQASNSRRSGHISDEDKMRLQLFIDVDHYGKEIQRVLSIACSEIPNNQYNQLYKLVESYNNNAI